MLATKFLNESKNDQNVTSSGPLIDQPVELAVLVSYDAATSPEVWLVQRGPIDAQAPCWKTPIGP